MTDPFDRVLRDAARRGRSVGVCPDAARLAAYVDDGLTPAERREVEAHAAGCATCQQHLGLLGTVSVEPGAPETARSWFPRWAWLVPAATAVLVAAVWIRLPPTGTEVPADVPAMPSSTSPARGNAAPAEEKRTDNEQAEQTAPPPARRRAVPAEPAAKADEIQPLKKPGEREAAGNLAATAPASPPAPVASPASPPAPRAAAPVASDAAAAPPVVGQESFKAKELDDQVATEGVAGGQAAARAEASRDARDLTVAVSDKESYRAKGQQIEMSSDGGQTWRQVAASPGGPYTAAACAQDICWFGTADGRVERRIRGGQAGSILPTREAVTAIAPVDAKAAVVTVASGRRFRTTDAGATWNPEP